MMFTYFSIYLPLSAFKGLNKQLLNHLAVSCRTAPATGLPSLLLTQWLPALSGLETAMSVMLLLHPPQNVQVNHVLWVVYVVIVLMEFVVAANPYKGTSSILYKSQGSEVGDFAKAFLKRTVYALLLLQHHHQLDCQPTRG
jgi:hypothetical protein